MQYNPNELSEDIFDDDNSISPGTTTPVGIEEYKKKSDKFPSISNPRVKLFMYLVTKNIEQMPIHVLHLKLNRDEHEALKE